MKKLHLESAVKKELGFIAIAAAVCSVLLQAVFLLVSLWVKSVHWNYAVVLGGVLGYCLTVFNFFLMSLAVQRSVSDPDPRHAQLMMKASYSRRSVMILAVMVVSFVVDQIHWLPVAAAVFYPTLSIFARQFFEKYVLKKSDDPPAGTVTPAPIEEDEGQEDEFEKAISHFAGKIDTDYLKNVPEESGENTKESDKTGEKEG